MKKQQAIEIFKTQVAIANALGITKSAVSQWPEELDQRLTDELHGAAIRLGLIKPDKSEAA